MDYHIDRSALKFWTEKEMRLEGAHLLDLCDEALRKGQPVWTPFLGQALGNWLEGVLQREGLAFRREGGFPDAERVRFLVGEDPDALDNVSGEICALQATTVDPRGKLDHRQVLGSLIGLGLKREVIGDIRLTEQCCFVAVAREIADFLLSQWDKAGRERIRVEAVEKDVEIPLEQGKERRITAASSRIDAVAAGGFNVSRTMFQELIQQGKVKRNDRMVAKADLEVKPGDILSCRGYGRMRLLEFQETRKGRIAWNVILYTPHKH